MNPRLFIIVPFFAAGLSAVAGEKPLAHLTGNSRVDFFGDRPSVPLLPTAGQGMLDAYQAAADEPGDKSPWLAGFMSLLVPGSGEVYSGNYLKGAIFFTTSAASWITSVVYNRMGDRETNQFQDYANAHYSAVKYVNWTIDNVTAIDPGLGTPPAGYSSWSAYYTEKIYGGPNETDPNSCGPPFKCINWVELNDMEATIANNGYTHEMPYWNQQQYYELIGKYDQFSRGWDDANLSDVGLPIVRNSARMTLYGEMRAQANYKYDVASTFVSVAVVGHILSAIDAFWSVTQYNKNLHAQLRMNAQPTPYGLMPVMQADLRVDF